MTHVSTRTRRAFFAATLAATSLVCGAGQVAKTDADQAAAAPARETAREVAPVDAGPSLAPTSINPPAPPTTSARTGTMRLGPGVQVLRLDVPQVCRVDVARERGRLEGEALVVVGGKQRRPSFTTSRRRSGGAVSRSMTSARRPAARSRLIASVARP